MEAIRAFSPRIESWRCHGENQGARPRGTKFHETKLKGAFFIEPELLRDDRGFFVRSWCRREAEAQGLRPDWLQCNISFNDKRGTLRGMRWQAAPCEEIKLVRCSRGAIYDVVIDLRRDSATFMQWIGVELSAENYRMMYVPKGFAHGFLTLEDRSEVFYQMSEFYFPEAARGVRYDDPAFGTSWPLPVTKISRKDLSWSLLERIPHL